jgi:hypothetical protein
MTVGDEMTVRDSIIQACSFGGYGAWNAKLWICGIEEHGEGETLTDSRIHDWVCNLPASGVSPPFEEPTRSAAWRLSFRLAAATLTDNPDASAFQRYWIRNPDALLLTNINVIPRRRIADFNLTGIGRSECAEIIRDVRVPILRGRRAPNSVVVCHGVEVWELAKAAFLPKDAEEAVKVFDIDGRYIEVYATSKTVFSPFFGYRQMPNELFKKLIQAVRGLVSTTH